MEAVGLRILLATLQIISINWYRWIASRLYSYQRKLLQKVRRDYTNEVNQALNKCFF